jgi:hypothetical protein
MPYQANRATHAQIKCSRRFYQGTGTRRYFLVREAYVISSTALYIFSLEGQVPDKIVKGQTSDISTLTQYAWYEWVKFQDTALGLQFTLDL